MLYLDAFYKPTLEVHTTAASMMARLELTDEGRMSFASGPTRAEARHAIVMAHEGFHNKMDTITRQGLETTFFWR